MPVSQTSASIPIALRMASVRDRTSSSVSHFRSGSSDSSKAEETGGAFMMFEDQMSGGKMTPLHTHPDSDSDESMFILEGEVLMHINGTEYPVSKGGLGVAPRGVPHAFMVISPYARMLCLHTPGCCQAFYWDASTPLDPNAVGGTVDFGKVQAPARLNGGIELLRPPPFGSR